MLSTAHEDRQSASTAGLAPRRERLGIIRLVLTDFRNYRSARLDFGRATGGGPEILPVVLTGPNGAGKTNLLEAMSFLSPGRGLRNARLSDIDRRGGPANGPGISAPGNGIAEPAGMGWAVAATVATRRGPLSIGTGRIGTGRDATAMGLRPTGLSSGERRAVRIDGEPVRGQSALGERLGVLWLTPQMDRLFLEGPEGRRRLMDRLVLGLDPAHAARVARYEQALRERARLLRATLHGGRNDPAWLAALEDIMAAEGIAVAAARRDAIDRLDRVCAAAEGAFPRARLSVVGTVEGWLDDMPALATEERFRAMLAERRPGDALSGGAATGPHRSDLAVVHADKGIAAEAASTGEQKALLIAILLAQAQLQRAVRGEPPLLLLDEMAAHLDRARREALFEIVAGLGSQAWITGTDPALFAPLRGAARFLSVNDGELSETSI
jgi:DNA replication and repair protein RecF